MTNPARPVASTSSYGGNARLGRALIYVHRQILGTANAVVRGRLGALLIAGEAMDYAVRLKDHGSSLTPTLASQFATQAGIGEFQLFNMVLPKLQEADLIDYDLAVTGSGLSRIDEFVGLSGRIIDQAMRLAMLFNPSAVELAVLHSIEIASWAPLTVSQHAEQLARRGFLDEVVEDALKLTLAIAVNQRVWSPLLNEYVVFNPHVWGAESASIAGFLRSLPSTERDSLLGMCEQASTMPGLDLTAYGAFSSAVVNSARKVGLLQSATVRSSRAGSTPQTYVFSPLQESEDDKLMTTEALHHRKLFLAHILYGHQRASSSQGRIFDPRILVDRLLNRGTVGPATNIASDYHLLESFGIVAVRQVGGGRAYLDAVKEDVIAGGLLWLNQSFTSAGSAAGPGDLMPPSSWITPEADRTTLENDAVADELTTAAILKLREAREEAQRAARYDF